MMPDILGLDERLNPEFIKFWASSRKFKDCPSCKSKVEYHEFKGLSDVFCPLCKSKINIEAK
jgi:formamidopyrimidine-DNA glycosylase